ncbi:MAG: hypothetical protein AAGD32_17610, partial [Planctomycetota bacterium]
MAQRRGEAALDCLLYSYRREVGTWLWCAVAVREVATLPAAADVYRRVDDTLACALDVVLPGEPGELTLACAADVALIPPPEVPKVDVGEVTLACKGFVHARGSAELGCAASVIYHRLPCAVHVSRRSSVSLACALDVFVDRPTDVGPLRGTVRYDDADPFYHVAWSEAVVLRNGLDGYEVAVLPEGVTPGDEDWLAHDDTDLRADLSNRDRGTYVIWVRARHDNGTFGDPVGLGVFYAPDAPPPIVDNPDAPPTTDLVLPTATPETPDAPENPDDPAGPDDPGSPDTP